MTENASRRRRLLAGGTVVAALLAVVWARGASPGRGEKVAVSGPPQAMPRQLGDRGVAEAGRLGVPGRPADAANQTREAYVRDPAEASVYRAALEQGEILDPQAPGELADVELRLALLDPVEAYRDEESCRERFADWPSGEACAVRIEVVVDRTGDGEGRIAYARGRAGEGASPSCEEFARCMAGARFGRRVPLPGTVDRRPAAITSTYPANEDRTCDLDQLRSMRAALAADLEAAAQIPAGELPDGTFRTAFQERLLDYLNLRIRDCS